MNFISYIFSRSKISWTLIINFIGAAYYYVLITQGIDSFYVSPTFVLVIGIFITGIIIVYWRTSYDEFKNKIKI